MALQHFTEACRWPQSQGGSVHTEQATFYCRQILGTPFYRFLDVSSQSFSKDRKGDRRTLKYMQRDTVARSRKHYCNGNTSMRSVCPCCSSKY